jgi:hypothetical protein
MRELDIVEEVLIEPVDKILLSLGEAIAETQKALDRASVELQIAAENDPVLSKYDYQAPWYYMPEIELELKLALGVNFQQVAANVFKKVMVAAPINATYKNRYDYQVEGTSVLKVKIVSVPPGRKVD